MKLVRHISTIGFYLTKIIAIGYLVTALHVIISAVFKLSSFKPLENNRFAICYPFTSKPLLIGSENTTSYIFEMVAILIFYSAFFWLLSNVFKTFRQQKLFTVQGVLHLKWFYILNLFIYPILFIALMAISHEYQPYLPLLFGHVIIGIFALFLAAIFVQGLKLQNDQDLYI